MNQQYLKMDKPFIDAEDEKGKQEEMITSIIALGHAGDENCGRRSGDGLATRNAGQ